MKSAAAITTTLLRMLCVVLAAAVALPAGSGFVTSAHAQEAGERQGGGLLRFLFSRDRQKQDRAAPVQQEAPRRATTTTTRRAAAPAEPVVPAVEKSENARRVIVVGDFLAGGLAEGLTAAFVENADVVVVDRSNGSSGLVRDDHYDWPGRIAEVLDVENPAVVVVMIGSNDRQQMRVEGTREQPRTEAWTAEYERRVTALAKGVRDKDLPLIWVGNLPFKSTMMTSDMVAFNDIYRRIATELGGEFLDVWDGFVNEAGAFVASGPDMNGQPAQLRASDGINVTRQGRRKIAFYVEKPLGRLLGTGGQAPGLARIGPDSVPGIDDDAGPREIDRTNPVSLQELDGAPSGELLGAFVTPRNGEARTAAERLIFEGVPTESRPGRADNFSASAPASDPQRPAPISR